MTAQFSAVSLFPFLLLTRLSLSAAAATFFFRAAAAQLRIPHDCGRKKTGTEQPSSM